MPKSEACCLQKKKKMGDSKLATTSNHATEETNREEQKSQDCNKMEFSEDEELLIARMFNLVGERWALIAGRIPGRTAEEIEKYWTVRHKSS
ncbi:MYB-like transcription factor ETC1 [Mangifera indica]|uniref:MYB-like transcription factor ETC1 n=1 Tax=Mangifera indica TaxID=29780 RepID=UPI001CF9D6F7|nr:MYB-like transcription factor ETC1 [Mangifera indica]